MQQLERIRLQAGQAMGLGDVSNKVIPKPVLLSPPTAGGTLQVRYFMPHNCHRSLAITGSIGISTACVVENSVAQTVLPEKYRQIFLEEVNIEHPSGKIAVSLMKNGELYEDIRASVIRTARKLFVGNVFIPSYSLETADI
jgi:2-methylaconitate cis-trans-isomerase PrpF